MPKDVPRKQNECAKYEFDRATVNIYNAYINIDISNAFSYPPHPLGRLLFKLNLILYLSWPQKSLSVYIE